jgi:uncharacterized protein YutE (UPF0331/DUF86 family)
MDEVEKKRTEINGMYYVNLEQIEERLNFMSYITDSCKELTASWRDGDALLHLAQERALHLAIESVTDVGSLLIDAFILRDASSYEDIVDILHGEGLFSESMFKVLQELVKLRRPLVQNYVKLDRSGLHPLIGKLPDVLPQFAEEVRDFIRKES